MVACEECGEESEKVVRGLCRPCYAREHYRKEKEYHRAKSLRWKRENPEKARAMVLQWQRENPEKARAKNARYYAGKQGLPNTLTPEQAEEILARGICFYCGDTEGPFHLEHKIPVCQGGGFTEENIVCACARCNFRKGAKSAEEFLAILSSERD